MNYLSDYFLIPEVLLSAFRLQHAIDTSSLIYWTSSTLSIAVLSLVSITLATSMKETRLLNSCSCILTSNGSVLWRSKQVTLVFIITTFNSYRNIMDIAMGWSNSLKCCKLDVQHRLDQVFRLVNIICNRFKYNNFQRSLHRLCFTAYVGID